MFLNCYLLFSSYMYVLISFSFLLFVIYVYLLVFIVHHREISPVLSSVAYKWLRENSVVVFEMAREIKDRAPLVN